MGLKLDNRGKTLLIGAPAYGMYSEVKESTAHTTQTTTSQTHDVYISLTRFPPIYLLPLQGAFYIFKGKAGSRRGYRQAQARAHVPRAPALLLAHHAPSLTQPTRSHTHTHQHIQGPVLAENGGDNFARTLSLSGDGRVASLGSTSWATSQGAVWNYVN